MAIEVLDEKILFRDGCFLRIRRWLRGSHASLGILTQGYTGIETVVFKDVIRPLRTFWVVDTKELLPCPPNTVSPPNFPSAA